MFKSAIKRRVRRAVRKHVVPAPLNKAVRAKPRPRHVVSAAWNFDKKMGNNR